MRNFLLLLFITSFSILSRADGVPMGIAQEMKRLQVKESHYWKTQDWENHMLVCHEFLVNYEHYLSKEKKASWNIKIGSTFIQLKSYLLAVEYLQKAIRSADGDLKSFAYGQLGKSYIDLGEYDKALESYSLAIKFTQSSEVIMAHTNSMGFVNFKANRFQESRNSYKKAIELFNQDAKIDSIQYQIVQSNLASVDFVEGDTASAMRRLNYLENSIQGHNSWLLWEVYGKMLPTLLDQKDCDEIERVLDELAINVDDAPYSKERLKFLEFKIKFVQNCGNQEGMSDYLQQYFSLNEAIKQQNIDQIIIIEKLQRDELKRRLKLVSDNLQLKKESEKYYLRLVIVSISLLSLVLIGAFLWWRTVKLKQRRKEKFLKLREELMRESERSTELKREMEAKELVNKKLELKQMLQSMNNNVTLLEEIQGRLGVLRNKEEGVQEGIMDLLTFLKSHAGAQAVNDVIEQNVETIGGDFRDRFFEKHGEFTPSEIQLLLLLRIGLSTKEMALMKSVEPSSIRIFKHRLKIKLGLEKGQDIQSYIQNF